MRKKLYQMVAIGKEAHNKLKMLQAKLIVANKGKRITFDEVINLLIDNYKVKK